MRMLCMTGLFENRVDYFPVLPVQFYLVPFRVKMFMLCGVNEQELSYT